MSGIETTGSKRLVLVSGRAHPELAEQIAAELGTELMPTDARFSASIMMSCSISHSLMGDVCDWITKASVPRTLSSKRA